MYGFAVFYVQCHCYRYRKAVAIPS